MTIPERPDKPPDPQVSPCGRCRRERTEPIGVLPWQWRLRDTKPKPPGGQLGVLYSLSARLDPATGCGRAALKTIAGDTGQSVATVERAIAWAEERFLLRQVVRGHRVTGRAPEASLWHLMADKPTADARPIPHG